MKKLLTKLKVRREVIRTLEKPRRSFVAGQTNCTFVTSPQSNCILFAVAPPGVD